MIIYRQRLFSSKKTKIVHGTLKIADNIKHAVIRAPKKSKAKLAREAIEISKDRLTKEGIKRAAVNKVVKSANAVKSAAYFPGHTVNKGIDFAVSSPVGAATQVGMMAVSPLGVAQPGTTAAGLGTEFIAKKIPAYKKITDKMGSAWRNSKLSRAIDGINTEHLTTLARQVAI